MSRDYEEHYRDLSEKLNRDREQDMQALSEWYLNTKSLALTSEEHLEIMELFGFERQESSDEFSLEESDYVGELSVKFNSWFKKRWEFLEEYYKIMQSASNSFSDTTSLLKDMEWNSEFEVKTAEVRGMIYITARSILYNHLDIVLEEGDDYSPSEDAIVLTEEGFNNWSKKVGLGFGQIEIVNNVVYLDSNRGGRHSIGYKNICVL